MSWSSITFTFSPSTVAKSSEVNQNFTDVVAGLNTAMPSNGIIMWGGAIVDIPAGWYLCDGNNSTPDLRGRFVIGAGGAYAKGAIGGAETINLQHYHSTADHVLSWNEMPYHNHGDNGHGHGDSGHGHGVNDPGHQHTPAGTIYFWCWDNSGEDYTQFGSGTHSSLRAATDPAATGISIQTGYASITTGYANISYAGANWGHNHGNTGNQLSASQSIMPPYYALAYIKKS